MKNRFLWFATALFVVPSVVALAADSSDFSGSVEVGGIIADDPEEGAKFQEYRDVDDGFIGNLNMRYFKSGCFVDFEGMNISRDDQSYLLEGGRYGQFDYSLFYDETPHNLSFDAKSFYSGIDGDSLTIDAMSPSVESSWRVFDYSVDRKKYGGLIGASLGSPFFVNLSVNREEKDGLKPLGSGSFSGQVEMPEPVDYKTDNLTLSGGYRSTEILFKLTGSMSSFDNKHESLSWTNPFNGAREMNTLPPDNDYGKIAANLTWRKLPLMSTLLINGSYANLSNDFSVDELRLSAPGGLNRLTFDGDISYTNLSASVVSRPSDVIDMRLFYDYLDKNNNSSVIEYSGGGNASHMFEYTKNDVGLDLNYKVSRQTKFSAGYEFENIDRTNRPDVDSNMDNIFFLKLKNTSLDFLTAKLEYTYLNRDADEDHDLTGVSIYDAEYIEQYVQRFDNTTKTKNAIKLVLELFPTDKFDVGLEYAYAINDYSDITLGRTEDKGHELYLDCMWRPIHLLNLSAFAGYEKYEADSNHYNYQAGAGTPPQTAVPIVEDGNRSSYRWTQSLDDDFWTIGAMVEMPLMEDRLRLSISGQYQQSDGQTDFTSGGSSSLLPIDQADDYDITTVEAKVLYALSKQLDLTFGYLYEKAKYEDLQYLGYEYDPGGSYLSGAYADYDYETHVGYLTLKYSF